jgi:hypothetical protein
MTLRQQWRKNEPLRCKADWGRIMETLSRAPEPQIIFDGLAKNLRIPKLFILGKEGIMYFQSLIKAY